MITLLEFHLNAGLWNILLTEVQILAQICKIIWIICIFLFFFSDADVQTNFLSVSIKLSNYCQSFKNGSCAFNELLVYSLVMTLSY